jgi:uncharacterized protein (UPF0305 family)
MNLFKGYNLFIPSINDIKQHHFHTFVETQKKTNTSRELTQIINKDRKTSTYKFSLIKGIIESIHKYDHYCQIKDNKVTIPLGLMTLLWIK